MSKDESHPLPLGIRVAFWLFLLTPLAMMASLIFYAITHLDHWVN